MTRLLLPGVLLLLPFLAAGQDRAPAPVDAPASPPGGARGPLRQMEALGRGVVAIHRAPGEVFVGWRLLGTDAEDIAFNVYRTSDGPGSRPVRINDEPIARVTWTLDRSADLGCASNNGSKRNPCLIADILGDWREEVIWRTRNGKELRIFTSTFPTEHRLYTLLHDPIYRLGVAWQNVAYNQPPHTGFFLGHGMDRPPRPAIVTRPAEPPRHSSPAR